MSTSILVLLAALVLAVAIGAWAVQANRQRTRLMDRATEGVAGTATTGRIILRVDEAGRAERVRETVESLLPDGLLAESSTKRLVRAGFDSTAAPAIFALLRVLSALLFPAIALGVAPRSSSAVFVGSMACGVALGLMFPSFMLGRLEAARKQRVLRSVPDCLDLLLVCVESGVSLDAALLRVAREMLSLHPELANELLVVNRKTNAGMRREDALHGLFDRTGVDELRTLSSSMIQSERWGSSIGRVLRVYSVSLRRKRRQTAEKMAATAATKMMFPMVFFILPALFAVIGGPMMIGLRPILDALGN